MMMMLMMKLLLILLMPIMKMTRTRKKQRTKTILMNLLIHLVCPFEQMLSRAVAGVNNNVRDEKNVIAFKVAKNNDAIATSLIGISFLLSFALVPVAVDDLLFFMTDF